MPLAGQGIRVADELGKRVELAHETGFAPRGRVAMDDATLGSAVNLAHGTTNGFGRLFFIA